MKKSEHFVLAEFRLDEIRMFVDIVNQPLLVFAHPEEIILLRDDAQLLLMLRALAAFIQFLLRVESLTANAIVAAIFIEVDISAVVDLLQNRLNNLLVIIISGADKEIVTDVQFLPQFLKTDHRFITVLPRLYTPFFGSLCHLLTVFIGTGQEECFIPQPAMKPRQDIGQNGCVGVADVGLIVYVVDWCCDVELAHPDFPLRSS